MAKESKHAEGRRSRGERRPDGRRRLVNTFGRFSEHTARATGSPIAFVVAVVVIATWAVTGPIFSFSNTWQLVINTGTTIVTFLMVFVIQSAQNRDSAALQVKLDELLKVLHRERWIDIEDLDETELENLQKRMRERYGGLKPEGADED